jgi:hypothetical protein
MHTMLCCCMRRPAVLVGRVGSRGVDVGVFRGRPCIWFVGVCSVAVYAGMDDKRELTAMNGTARIRP